MRIMNPRTRLQEAKKQITIALEDDLTTRVRSNLEEAKDQLTTAIKQLTDNQPD